jgi:periplasmic copper chaperone A
MSINFRSPQRLLAGAGLAALAFIASQSTAFAHITLATGEARTGTYYKAVFQIPHGCDGAATQTVRIQIPEGVIGVKPMPKSGWTLNIIRGAYANSYQSHGKAVTEGPKEIMWSGGALSDDNYDEFVFTSFLAGDFSPGQAISFPTVQQCAMGEIRWDQIAADGQNPHSLKSPAPTLRIVADTATVAQAKMDHSKMDHAQVGAAAQTGSDTFKIGDLVVASPWTRATPSGAKIAGGYLKITNNGKSPDRLVSATSIGADRVEIHEMSMTDGVMKMRPLTDGLTIKPGETVELKPGGFHMMFMDIKQQLKQGDTLKATLTFEKAGKLDLSFNVRAIGAGGGAPAHRH